jgi:LDH2 family malate/lactate/ureidoglycolate dehydrogenase
LYDFTVQVFARAGLPLEDARLAASARLESALRQPAGVDAFSIMRLHNTVRRLQEGGINPRPCITVVREQAHIALLDGDNGLGAVVGTRAMECCLAKAQGQGLALVGVRNSTTLGMMAFYAMHALKHHAIGFVATNTELKIGLPPWVIGDHKGYGLALVLEVLTGVLTGAGFGQAHAPERLDTSAAHHDLGHLFGVLDPTALMPLELFYMRIQQLRLEIAQVQRAPGVERILLPGELEDERCQERRQHGIPVHDGAPAALQTLCAALALDSPLGP